MPTALQLEFREVFRRHGAAARDFVASTVGGSIGARVRSAANVLRIERWGFVLRVTSNLGSAPTSSGATVAQAFNYLWYGARRRNRGTVHPRGQQVPVDDRAIARELAASVERQVQRLESKRRGRR